MRKKYAILIILAAAVSLQFLYSYNWPVNEPVITSTFGGDKWGTFGSGVELYGAGTDVRPSETGELIFYQDAERPGVLPGGMGDFIVLEHDRKLRTLYAGIKPAEGIEDRSSFTTSEVIGTAGAGGKSALPHLHFSVIDSEFEQYVNPLLLMNSIIDNRDPVIDEIRIVNGSGATTIVKKAVVQAGSAEILVRLFDPCMSDDFNCRMAPYKIQLFLNGEELFYLNFESLKYDEKEAVIQSRKNYAYSDFYRDDGLISLGTISLVPGDSRFEILVSDYSDNEAGTSFQLTVIE